MSFLDVRGDISERKAEAVKKTRLWQYNGTGGKEFFKQILCACTVVNKRYDL